MKKRVKIITLCIFFVGLSTSLFAQNVVAQRQPANVNLIPKIVKNTFKEQYPNVLLKGWYVTHLVYWQNDYSSDWYSNWYGPRKVVVYTYQKPNYFEVEFMDQPGELSRAIYNSYGYWYETRTRINGLTMGIYDALKASDYNSWRITKPMEKLVSPMSPIEIFRFQVTRGMRAQILSMDAQGNIIQIKELNNE